MAIFAKAPIPGFAKTRLVPRLGAEGAAALQRRLIERTVDIAITAEVGPVHLWCAPGPEHEVFAALGAQGAVELRTQAEGDLGARMLRAFEVTAPKTPTLLIGTDCCVLTAEHLKAAAARLCADFDAVFIPVEDGGYILVGMNRPIPELFSDMPWNSAEVMPETRRRARTLGLRIAELETLWDIDRPEDYDRALAAL